MWRTAVKRLQLLRRHLQSPSLSKPAAPKLLSTSARDEGSQGPLAGLKVLDLSRILAAPFCTQILADYGADVIKVEQRGTGDDSRQWTVSGEAGKWKTKGPMSFYFNAINRNKRSITLDLKKPEGRDILLKLAKSSDVLIENFVPGKVEELGIGYDVVSRINPHIIYASISGYGPSGPYAKRAGYDAIAAAEAGLMHISGEPGQLPVRPGLGMVDMCTGLYMHGAILAALKAREKTGKGQKLDASLFETQISLLVNIGASWLNLGLEGKRYGNAHPSIAPYNTFKAKDGYMALGANNDRQFKILAERIGRKDLLHDPRFQTNGARVQHRETLDAILNDILREKPIEEWMVVFDGSGLAHGPVNTIEKAFQHPQIQARNMVESLPCEDVEAGELRVIGVPVKFSETKGSIRSRAPFLGEHSDEILAEMGYTSAEMEELRSREVV
ncbi:CoA-transferase [Phyllosticta citribraziliensis]|uniref:CoA-transferase n=1 Tax=Phyllosticta citribraziliensis TaxID=989973 RepID=A0ABR1LNB7_9PEZI